MATAPQAVPTRLTLEQYLQTSYRPDCDFVDGVLEERNVGDAPHGMLQMWLGYWFVVHAEWRVKPIGQLRTLVGKTKVRLPDVAVAPIDEALGERPRKTPPLIAIEILSPDDRMTRVLPRLRDFLDMGIPHVWLIDPVKRLAHTYTSDGLKLVESSLLTIDGSPIYLDLPKLFAYLDESA